MHETGDGGTGSHHPATSPLLNSPTSTVLQSFEVATGLKHRQFQHILSELESAYGDVLYYRGPMFEPQLPEIKIWNPFVADIAEAQSSYQFELAELQNCDVLKDALKPNSLIDFYASLPNGTYPNIKK